MTQVDQKMDRAWPGRPRRSNETYIGIDIGGTNLKAGLTDESGRLLAVKSMTSGRCRTRSVAGGHPG